MTGVPEEDGKKVAAWLAFHLGRLTDKGAACVLYTPGRPGVPAEEAALKTALALDVPVVLCRYTLPVSSQQRLRLRLLGASRLLTVPAGAGSYEAFFNSAGGACVDVLGLAEGVPALVPASLRRARYEHL